MSLLPFEMDPLCHICFNGTALMGHKALNVLICMSHYEFRRMRPVLLSLSITLLFTSFPSSRAGKHLLTSKRGRQFLVETSGPIEEKQRAAKERATNKHVATSKDRRQSAQKERATNRQGTWKI